MAGPDVAWVVMQRGTGEQLGLGELTVLLQAEGVHALDVAPSPFLRRPGPQHTRHDALEIAGLAEKEVEVLGHLERQEVL
jgi:hypothetical protein